MVGIILFCIQICRFVACEDEVTLDLSSDSSLFLTTEHLLYDVKHEAFLPRDGHYVSSVAEGTVEIWTKRNEDEKCTGVYRYSREGYPSLLVIYTERNGAKDETFCFEKNGSKWNEITLVGFNEKLYSMRDFSRPIHNGHNSDEHAPTVKDVTLDITTVDKTTEQPTNEGVYVEKSTRNIPIVPFEEAMKELDYFREILRTKVPLPKVPEYTLDISRTEYKWTKNLHFVKLYGEIHNGFKQKKYVPMYGKNMRTDDGTFTKVVEGSTTIWTAEPHERCGYVSYFRHYCTKHLLAVAVAGRGDFIQYDRFMKEGNKWKKVSVEEFQRKLVTIRTCKKCCGFIPSCWKYGDAEEAVYGVANMDTIVRGTCSSNLKGQF